MTALTERFEKFYIPEPNSGCWLWMSQLNSKGYGIFHLTGARKSEKVQAHRMSWSMFRGEIPNGIYVLHQCDVPCCVNPDHLFLGTHADNMADMKKKGRARSPQGQLHKLSKLTDDAVKEIRKSTETNLALAAKFGVSDVLISLARRRKIWNHLP